MNAERRWQMQLAANDRVPRDRRPLVTRFANMLGKAVLALHLLAIASLFVALRLGSIATACAFLGAAIGAGVTMILISLFERRLNG